MDVRILNGTRPRGCVALPPSKSEAIRAALLLALSGADPRRAVKGFEPPICRDIENALRAAEDLREGLVGESAALERFLIPIQAALFGRVSLCAKARLLARGLREAEECFGVSLSPAADGRIESVLRLEKSVYELDCSRSSQFLSGLLIALPLLDRSCEIIVKNGIVSRPYVDMTLDFVRLFGGIIEETGRGFITRPSVYTEPERVPVTGDRSYAAAFEAMNAFCGDITLTGSSPFTRQPDKRFLMISALDDCDITDCPDLLPVLAVTACGKAGDTVIRGTARLSTKESDRESGTVKLIRDLGGSANVGADCVMIHGTGSLAGGACDTYGDHRMAYAAAVASLIARSHVTVRGAECTEKSGPAFWRDLASLGVVCFEV